MTYHNDHKTLRPCTSDCYPKDSIFIILGCNVPAILWQCDEKKEYEVVGECRVNRFMREKLYSDLEAGSISSRISSFVEQ